MVDSCIVSCLQVIHSPVNIWIQPFFSWALTIFSERKFFIYLSIFRYHLIILYSCPPKECFGFILLFRQIRQIELMNFANVLTFFADWRNPSEGLLCDVPSDFLPYFLLRDEFNFYASLQFAEEWTRKVSIKQVARALDIIWENFQKMFSNI